MARTGIARKDDDLGFSSDRASLPLQALVAEARAQQQNGIAERLVDAIDADRRKRSSAPRMREYAIPPELSDALVELKPSRRLKDLVLAPETSGEIQEFIDEYSEIGLLRSHGLEPRHKVLLVGPPGTGKTSLAEILSHELRLPFYVVRYDGLIASYLGETASRLRRLTDFVAGQSCVVFFDEFDTVGKERGDTQETGEIKRVVSSLLLQMDAIPTNCVIVCATNHPELLDRAVWRRFELRVDVPLPRPQEISQWFHRLRKDYGDSIAFIEEKFVRTLNGLNFSDIEAFTLDVRRKVVLSRGKLAADQALLEGLAKLRRKRSIQGGAEDSRPADHTHSPKRKRAQALKGEPKGSLPEGSLL